MKQLPIILVAVISIALGIWLGMPEQKPVTGYEHLGGDFVVQSTNGDVKLEDFRGKIVPIYFGFAACPDVCITALSGLSMALRSLPHDEMAQIQTLFISIDPDRDTPAKADEYAKYFHPSIIGASTDAENLKAIAKRYLVIYAKVAMEDSAMKYTMDHSSKIYFVGREGKILSTASHGESAEQLAKQLKAALAY